MVKLLPLIVEIVEQAGEAILAIYHKGCSAQEKQDKSPLTEADLVSHHLIVSRLSTLSDLPVLSEESAAIDWPVRKEWKRYWLIDPLDGTKEFLNRNGEFTVNIALIDGGRPVLGVVHVPVLKKTYFAARGVGAFCQEAGRQPVSLHVESSRSGSLRVVGSRSHQSEEMERFLAFLGDVSLVSMGSSLKFCLVAEGAADLYPRLAPTSEWDTAAAQCIVEEAGGEVLTDQLQPLMYNTKASLRNSHFIACGARSAGWAAFFTSTATDAPVEPKESC
jgi:3'(2'), 5'-bisphosphate nucleotidase